MLYAGLIPAAVALASCFALTWALPDNAARRYVPGAPFALAVFAGFALLPGTDSLVPTQFWDWAPYLGLLAALVAGVTSADGALRVRRWLCTLLVCVLAALLIVPTWDELAPPRPLQIAALATSMFAAAKLLETLPPRFAGRAFPFWLMVSAAAVSILLMADVSETFGTLAAMPVGALAGCSIATLLVKDVPEMRSLTLPYALVVGTYAYVGYVYPSPPLTPLLAVPAVPLALWICAVGPLSRLAGWRAIVAQAVCVLLPLSLIAVFMLLHEGSGGTEF